MGLHTKNLDNIINKLIPKETLPSVLSNNMENEIKKLIEKWESCAIGLRDMGCVDSALILTRFVEDLKSLLEFKQKNCCGKVEEIADETTENQTE